MYVELVQGSRKKRVACTTRCIAAAQTGYLGETGLLYLEIEGPPEANRAIWAHIVKHRRKERSIVPTNATIVRGGKRQNIYVLPGTKYHKRVQGNRMVLLHRKLDMTAREFVLGGDMSNPSPWFKNMFLNQIDVPVLEEWIPIFWHKGIEKQLVKIVQFCVGINVWAISMNTHDWQILAETLYEEGVLQWQD